MSKVFITGAGGFIGSAFVRRALATTTHNIRAFARLTDAVRLQRRLTDHPAVQTALQSGRLEIVYGDLCTDISGLCEGIDYVVNAAAKTFVDHSIRDPLAFFYTNAEGTVLLLEEARRQGIKRFIQVSTDEVYGPALEGAFDENAPIRPTNPYAASKAAADAVVQAYTHACGLFTVITRTENNYGPFQHQQKVMPTFIKKLMMKEKLPVYGDGLHARQWLWVGDHVDALLLLLEADCERGGIYHVAGGEEITNIELATRLIKAHTGRTDLTETEILSHIEFIDDSKIRPGHDRRYALNSEKLRKLGWAPQMTLASGINVMVDWHQKHPGWLGVQTTQAAVKAV